MRTYAPAGTRGRPRPPARGAVARPRRSSTTRHLPAAQAEYGAVPDLAGPADRRAGSRPAASTRCTPTRRRRSRPSTRARTSSVVTPTASGKTLCYALPVLQAIAEDPAARALFLFPTKALGQDQVAEFARAVASGRAVDRGGDVRRRHAGADPVGDPRRPGQVVVTNPDMLHSAILPHHTKWFQLFEQLRVIVIDELHTYRGVFGSHVANVIRAAAPAVRPLRQPPGDRVLLGDDREPGRAGRRCSPAGRRG